MKSEKVKNNEMSYINVPIYIEKSVKKLFKTKNIEKELVMQIKDYMVTYGIPTDTPLQLLKYVPDDNIDPNQMKLDLETGEVLSECK